MRVLEPKKYQAKQRKPKRRVKKTLFIVLILIIAVLGASYFLYKDKAAAPSRVDQALYEIEEPQKQGVLIEFTGAEFRDLYFSFAYPNTKTINEKTPITGNEAADDHIRKLATARGYRITSAPVANVFKDFAGEKLQERAAKDWEGLKKAAAKDKLDFELLAGYRSADDQRSIFMTRLNALGVRIGSIASGSHDQQINELLKTTAPPGYSRHHTGYTVDIACKSDTVAFKNSKCFEWLKANNYENAKKHGWIPSYPDGAGKQGPDPEEWEYVWVGLDAVTK